MDPGHFLGVRGLQSVSTTGLRLQGSGLARRSQTGTPGPTCPLTESCTRVPPSFPIAAVNTGQTKCIKTAQIYSSTVLEVRSPESVLLGSDQQVRFLLEAEGRIRSSSLSASSGHLSPLVYGHSLHPQSTPAQSLLVPLSSEAVSLPFIRTLVMTSLDPPGGPSVLSPSQIP